jgi:hypothetical protein
MDRMAETTFGKCNRNSLYYPLVNIQKANWKISILNRKTTIANGKITMFNGKPPSYS